MIGFACPWCDQQVSLQPQALAAGSITCPECRTQVELSVGPAVVQRDPGLVSVDLPLAA
jgi:transcription initiation factor IIE alpha subunit